jgi:hypothetical protein
MKFIYKIILATVTGSLVFSGCSKKELDLANPNVPSLASLNTEEGITRAAAGIHAKFGWESQSDYWWMVLNYHNTMGDNTWSSDFSSWTRIRFAWLLIWYIDTHS